MNSNSHNNNHKRTRKKMKTMTTTAVMSKEWSSYRMLVCFCRFSMYCMFASTHRDLNDTHIHPSEYYFIISEYRHFNEAEKERNEDFATIPCGSHHSHNRNYQAIHHCWINWNHLNFTEYLDLDASRRHQDNCMLSDRVMYGPTSQLGTKYHARELEVYRWNENECGGWGRGQKIEKHF